VCLGGGGGGEEKKKKKRKKERGMGLLGLFCNVINLVSTYIFTDFAKAQMQNFLLVLYP